jgi:hypothetical protein
MVRLAQPKPTRKSGLATEDGRRRRPPAGGLEDVEKRLPTKLTSTDTTEPNAGMLLVLHPRPAPSHHWSSD